MPSDFWSGWIVVITITGLVALSWAVFSVYFSAKGRDDGHSPVWDETLLEGNNAPPLWWFWFILSLLVITVVYLILYPGLGSNSGMLQWSHAGHMEHSAMMYDDAFHNTRETLASKPVEMLQSDAMAMASAERIFKQNCAACHGADAKGQASMFPNLTDNDWQWGGAPEQIAATIRRGRRAMMPAHGEIVGKDGIAELVRYISSLSKGNGNADVAKGRELFVTYCIACHDEDAEGSTLVGAPNLTDNIWLYGGSDEALTNTITNGRSGVMPAFEKRLDALEIRLLVAWLTRRGEPSRVTPAPGP
jgi:cytochrome c oxidase cbb3-type subunit 3